MNKPFYNAEVLTNEESPVKVQQTNVLKNDSRDELKNEWDYENTQSRS